MHRMLIRRTSPDGRRTCAISPSLARSWAEAPAERTGRRAALPQAGIAGVLGLATIAVPLAGALGVVGGSGHA